MALATFRSYSGARKHSNGLPILRIDHKLYVTGWDNLEHARDAVIALLGPNGGVAGRISLGHLDELGEARYAKPRIAKRESEKLFKNNLGFSPQVFGV